MRAFTLRVETGHDGLICVTSPEHKSLFVAEETLADALATASYLVDAFERGDGAPKANGGAPSTASEA